MGGLLVLTLARVLILTGINWTQAPHFDIVVAD